MWILIRKFIIWSFKLKDISKDIKAAVEKQDNRNAKYWKEKLKDQEEHLNRKHELELLDSEIELKKAFDEINKLKSREKELDQRECEIKKLIKEDAYVTEDVHNKLMEIGKNFMKGIGEFNKIKDNAIELKKRIE